MKKYLFFTLFLTSLSAWAVDQRQSPAPHLELARKAIAQANVIRREHNLPELRLDPTIAKAAQAHAADMATRKYFDHESPEGEGPFDRMERHGADFRSAAENIARGQRTAISVFEAWMDSPGHRHNLLNPAYRRHGIGWANGYWVHNFAD